MSGRKLKVLLSKGGLDGHDRGLKILTEALRDAGMEVIYLGLYRSPEEIVASAIQEDADVIGISTLSGAHNYIFSRVLELLGPQGQGKIVIGGGVIPDDDAAILKNLGVKEIFSSRTPVPEIVDYVQKIRIEEKKINVFDLFEKIKQGDISAAGNLMTLGEHNDLTAGIFLRAGLKPNPSQHIIGVTGAGGVGKSSLIDKLVAGFKKEGKTIGVIVCDPTDPTSGGAVLGDRIVFEDHFLDHAVFIRSIATRGHRGGVAENTNQIIKAMQLLEKDVIIVETIGVGQEDYEIRKLVKTLIFVLMPDLGGPIQLLKAGVIKDSDIIVINKADRPGADINAQMIFEHFGGAKPVLKTNSISGEGTPDLIKAIGGKRNGF